MAYVLIVPVSGSNFNRMEQVDTYILVQGLNPRTSGETIKHYFEAIARPAEVKDHVIFSVDHTEALVTFIHKPGKCEVFTLNLFFSHTLPRFNPSPNTPF